MRSTKAAACTKQPVSVNEVPLSVDEPYGESAGDQNLNPQAKAPQFSVADAYSVQPEDGAFGPTWEANHNHRSWLSNTDGTTVPRVFVAHGHNEVARGAVEGFLERLHLRPVVLEKQPNKGRSIMQKFVECSSTAKYAVVLLTPDDGKRARQNVVWECGFLAAKLGWDHVTMLKADDVEMPSNLEGLLYVKLDPNGAWQLRLAEEMKNAGLNINLNLAMGESFSGDLTGASVDGGWDSRIPPQSEGLHKNHKKKPANAMAANPKKKAALHRTTA